MTTQIQQFDFSVDCLRALLWQHNDAARLEALIRAKSEWYAAEHSTFWSDWLVDVFDLRTANDFGCAVWATILDIPIALTSKGDYPNKPIFGFGQYREGFAQGNFASTNSVILTLEQKRLVLQLRYFQLTTRGTVPEINAFFKFVFSSLGLAYVNDGYQMNARYVFAFPLSSSLETVLTEYDLLPRPAGVAIDYVIVGEADGFGFGRYHETFTNGNFYHA